MGKVVIIHYAAPPIIGGVESTIYHHALLLESAGYEVCVVAGRGEKFHTNIDLRLIPEIDSRHHLVLDVGKSLANGNVTDIFFRLRDRISDALYPILAGAQKCIVHNAITLHKNLPLTAALHSLVNEKLTKLIAWCHDFAWQDRLYTPDLHVGYPWDLLRNAWPGVNYVVVSQHRLEHLASLLSLPSDEIHVVTPGVDITKFFRVTPLTATLIDRVHLFEADPILLLPARITRRKNIEFAIRVIADLVESMPRALLVITGPPGPHNPSNKVYLQDLLTLVEKLGVSSNVQFLYQQTQGGEPLNISDSVMTDLYQLADLLFFPSHREGFGIPVLEAGLSRLPVFAADIPPVHESAGEWAQLFDPNGSSAEVAHQIRSHLKNDSAYQLRRRVIAKYSWQNIVRDHLIPLIQNQNDI